MRLPNCKHVFGDHCIKKWFEDSDSCPYCRDKVHSEPALPPHFRALQNAIRGNYRQNPGAENVPVATLVHHPLPSLEFILTSASNAPGPDHESYAFYRIMAQQQRDIAHLTGYQNNRALNSTPPRNAHAGERRSPPSEGSDTRRRTRARHGSSYSSHLAAMAGEQAPPQRSPPRQRVTPPGSLHWTVRYDRDSSRPLTSLLARQSMSISGGSYPLNYDVYSQPDPLLSPPEAQDTALNPEEPTSGRGPPGYNPAVVYLPIETLAAYEGGPPFLEQLQRVRGLDPTGLPSVSSAADGGQTTSAGPAPWMQ